MRERWYWHLHVQGDMKGLQPQRQVGGRPAGWISRAIHALILCAAHLSWMHGTVHLGTGGETAAQTVLHQQHAGGLAEQPASCSGSFISRSWQEKQQQHDAQLLFAALTSPAPLPGTLALSVGGLNSKPTMR